MPGRARHDEDYHAGDFTLPDTAICDPAVRQFAPIIGYGTSVFCASCVGSAARHCAIDS
jgi:hypothetical protein